MARLPLLDESSTPHSDVKTIFEQVRGMGLGKFMHQFATLGHHPPLLKAVFGLMQAYYEGSVVPRKYLEMAILVVSNHNRCRYCVVHHSPMALEAGLSPQQLDAINGEDWNQRGEFDEAERAVLDFAQQVTARGGRIDESLFQKLREFFTEEQLVELAVRTAMCEFFNRFNEIFQLEIEPVAQQLYGNAAS